MPSVTCDGCKRRTTKDYYCFGCDKYVCAKCDQQLPALSEHKLEDHFDARTVVAKKVVAKRKKVASGGPSRKVVLNQAFSNKLYGVLKHNLMGHPYISHMYNGEWWEEALKAQVGGVVEMLAHKGGNGKTS